MCWINKSFRNIQKMNFIVISPQRIKWVDFPSLVQTLEINPEKLGQSGHINDQSELVFHTCIENINTKQLCRLTNQYQEE